MKFNSANTNCQYNYIALKTISISRWSVPLDIYPLQLPFMTIPYNSHGKFTHYYHSHVRIPSKSVRIATGSHLWSFQLWSPRTRTRCASKRRIKRNRIWWYLSQWNLNSISCNLFFVASQFLNSVGLQLFFDIFFVQFQPILLPDTDGLGGMPLVMLVADWWCFAIFVEINLNK